MVVAALQGLTEAEVREHPTGNASVRGIHDSRTRCDPGGHCTDHVDEEGNQME